MNARRQGGLGAKKWSGHAARGEAPRCGRESAARAAAGPEAIVASTDLSALLAIDSADPEGSDNSSEMGFWESISTHGRVIMM
jgi:hypothetical protein